MINTSIIPQTPFIYLLSFSLTTTILTAQETKSVFKPNGFIDFNGYYDTREYSTFTYNILGNISERLQYFSLTNYNSGKRSSDLETNYAEHNLRWKISKTSSFDLTLQYVIRNGPTNDDIKLGGRWRLSDVKAIAKFFKKINAFYSINPMVVQFRRNTSIKLLTQIEHVYTILLFSKALKKRLYLGGFADQNFSNESSKNKGSIKWVSEHQLGYRVFKNTYVVLEYRINQFKDDATGLGYGLEYKIVF